MKKITSILLALVLLMGVLPVGVSSAEAAAGQAPAASGCSETEWEVLKLTNLVRWEEARLDPLTTFPTLQEAAAIRAEEQRELFGHDRPDGRGWSSVGDDVGLDMMMNENVAAGYGSARAVVDGWRESPAHYNGMMGAWANHYTNPEGRWSRREGYGYTMHVGIGERDNTYWVQLFQGKNPYSGSISAEINGYETDEEAIADHLKNNPSLCDYTALRLEAPGEAVPTDVPLSDMGIVGILTCRVHGDCYFPVLAEYCTGYDPDLTGKQTITVRVCRMSAQCTITTTEPEQIQSTEVDFADVGRDDYYHDAVQWAVQQGITGGTGADTFSPGAACTRGQVVTFLWRAAGSPEPRGSANPFADVSPDDYYFKAVLWAMEQGITGGTGQTTFSPAATCTRGQIVTFLWRFSGSHEPAGQASFADVQPEQYYAEAVAWAVENSITSGVGDNRFGPGNVCTRGQIVTFLWRASGSPEAGTVTVHVHTWTEEVVEPLCTGCGYRQKVCSGCGVYAVVDGSFTEPIGHDYVTTVVEPTEEDTGYTMDECSRCSLTYMVYDD